MIKIVKNTDISTIKILGLSIPAGQSFTIPETKWAYLSQFLTCVNNSAELRNYINTGKLVINNGSQDLDPTTGIEWLRLLHSNKASDQIFNNTSNGFTASTTQTAIEEAKNSLLEKNRFCLQAGFDGGASSGRWLEFIGNVSSDAAPFIIPFSCALKEITVSCQGSTTATITIYKNGSSLTSISVSSNYKAKVSGLSLSLSSLDEISVKVSSGYMSKPFLTMFFKVD